VGKGTKLVDLFAVDYAEVRLPIPQSKLEYLELPGIEGYGEGTSIDLYTDVAGEVKHWPATLHRTEGVFDERSRVLYAVARIEDPYALQDTGRQPIRLGTFVNANIAGREIDNIVSLPRHLLRAGNSVWVVDQHNILRNREVTVLRTGGDRALVSGGLTPGDRVSLTTLDSSLTGATVEIRSETSTDRLFSESPESGPTETAELPPGKETVSAVIAQ
jgi:hypothetical protein